MWFNHDLNQIIWFAHHWNVDTMTAPEGRWRDVSPPACSNNFLLVKNTASHWLCLAICYNQKQLFASECRKKRLATAGELRPTGNSAPTDTLAGFNGLLRGRGRTRKERMDNPLYHQFLDLPLLTHARAYNLHFSCSALIWRFGGEIKPPLIVWRYRLQWFVPPLHSPTVQGWTSLAARLRELWRLQPLLVCIFSRIY